LAALPFVTAAQSTRAITNASTRTRVVITCSFQGLSNGSTALAFLKGESISIFLPRPDF